MRRFSLLFCLGSLSLLALVIALFVLVTNCPAAWASDGNRAQLTPVGNSFKGSAEARSIIQNKGKLTLAAYLSAVDANFPGLMGAEDQRRIASANRLEKQGLFDPLFSTENGYTRMQNTSRIGDSKRVLFNYPKIEVPFRSGVRAFAQYRYNPNSAQSPYIETGEGGEYSVGLLLPLMRGLFYNEQSVAEKEAKLGEQFASQTFLLTRLDTLMKAGTNYWSWVGAKMKADVSRHIKGLSSIVVDIAKLQEHNGDLARIYVVEAEEDVERRDADLTQAERDFQRFSFRLSALLFDIGGVPLPLPGVENVPDDIPRPKELSLDETDRMIVIAIATRPELKAIDVQKKMAAIQLKLAENQLLPAMNAVVTKGYDTGKNGIGNVYRAQVTFSEPLLLRTARGKVAAAKLRLDKLGKERQAEEQRIKNEVMDAISAINLASKRFAALERQVRMAEQVYFGEKERFNLGDSTVFLMNERERQLNEAKVRVIDSQVEFQIGLLALKAITSQL